jgi:CDP-diacylglycerol--glycerol-3-phosphate 3-phosphatidyltransferase
MCLVPVILIVGFIPVSGAWWYVTSAICAALFIGASVTDMLDGKIARKNNLVTDFGKFMDPVADKFMVIGAMFVLLYRFNNLTLPLMLSLIVIVFRELAVTSMRLVASSGKGVVLAANYLGKLKTVSQIVAISTIFLEPVLQYVIKLIVEAVTGEKLFWRTDIIPLSWITLAFCVVMTVWSGLNYIISYWKYLDPEK